MKNLEDKGPVKKSIDIDTDVGSININTGNKSLDFAVFMVVAILLAAIIYGSFF